MKSAKRYAIWAMLNENDARSIQEVIDHLMGDDPTFAPHMTLCSMDGRPSDAEMRRIADQIPVLTLEIEGVFTRDSLSQALAIRLKPSRAFSYALSAVSGATSQALKLTSQPHVSLYYGDAPPRPDQFSIELPEAMMFDSISILEFESPFSSPAQVQDWKIGASWPLTGAA